MQAVPKSYYEAAEIDGANAWDKFRFITLPGIRSMIIVMVTIHVLWTFNNFDFVFLATGGGPMKNPPDRLLNDNAKVSSVSTSLSPVTATTMVPLSSPVSITSVLETAV